MYTNVCTTRESDSEVAAPPVNNVPLRKNTLKKSDLDLDFTESGESESLLEIIELIDSIHLYVIRVYTGGIFEYSSRQRERRGDNVASLRNGRGLVRSCVRFIVEKPPPKISKASFLAAIKQTLGGKRRKVRDNGGGGGGRRGM